MNKHTKRKILVAFLFLTMASISLASVSSARQTILANNSRYAGLLEVRLFDGNYGDYDDDGNEDDVMCYIEVTYLVEVHRKKYDCYIEMLLPNGMTFNYGFWVATTNPVVTLQLMFFNHAIASGDYTISAEVLFHFPGVDYYDATAIIFDPPSEKIPDSEPTFQIRH